MGSTDKSPKSSNEFPTVLELSVSNQKESTIYVIQQNNANNIQLAMAKLNQKPSPNDNHNEESVFTSRSQRQNKPQWKDEEGMEKQIHKNLLPPRMPIKAEAKNNEFKLEFIIDELSPIFKKELTPEKARIRDKKVQ